MISVALIGAGARGVTLAEYVARNPNTNLIAVTDIDAERSRRFCRKFQPDSLPVAIDQLPHLDVDAWIIATPDLTHCRYALLGLAGDVHVLCEKPVGVSLDELDYLDAALWLRSKNQVIMSAFVLRHHKFYRRLAEVVADIGVIHHASVHDLLWGSYMYRRWHRSRSATGGPVAHEGVHSLDQLAIMGIMDLRCEAVSAERAWFLPQPQAGPVCSKCAISDDCSEFFDVRKDPLRDLYDTPRRQEGHQRDLCVFNELADVEDLVTARLRSAAGTTVDYSLCLFSADQSRRFLLLGTDGTVVADEARAELTISRRRGGRQVIAVPRLAGLYGGSDEAMFQRFVERILLQDASPEDFLQAMQSSRIALGIEAKLAWS